ncbi:MAG: DegT/DnrJ/EryC1/StrS family aminotransferase, partial [Rhodocyclaceae bacterium]|nr:DegT/DnrJ/EryC1/StrS family aminotransferase [Rhodocyclaceae bacterium]
MQFIDLKTQFKHVEGEVRRRIDAVLEHGQFIMGPEVRELEERLAAFAGTRHCVSCASGTDALFMALMAKGVGRGDLVLTTPFTFVATAEVIALLGAVPVFVDVDPRSFNLDPACLEARLADLRAGRGLPPGVAPSEVPARLKGLITVDLFGLPCDYERIAAIAGQHGLWVLEDAAQSFGAEYRGRRACSLAEVGCTSFFPAKPLGGYGDGGAIFTDDADLDALLRSIRVHGQGADRYENVRLGVTGRLDTLQAAILLPKLDIFPAEIRERQRVAAGYAERLGAVPGLQLPEVPADMLSVWAQYCVLARDAGHR